MVNSSEYLSITNEILREISGQDKFVSNVAIYHNDHTGKVTDRIQTILIKDLTIAFRTIKPIIKIDTENMCLVVDRVNVRFVNFKYAQPYKSANTYDLRYEDLYKLINSMIKRHKLIYVNRKVVKQYISQKNFSKLIGWV